MLDTTLNIDSLLVIDVPSFRAPAPARFGRPSDVPDIVGWNDDDDDADVELYDDDDDDLDDFDGFYDDEDDENAPDDEEE
ncbi:MAG: hypothetical protein KDA25_00785 [Phycisphaerales bacterium]|nr:hypothetical protein [Phycisphaerales bacterium]